MRCTSARAWRTLEVEHEIVPNREERLQPFDLFRALHLFKVRVGLHVRNVRVLSELTIDQEENLTLARDHASRESHS